MSDFHIFLTSHLYLKVVLYCVFPFRRLDDIMYFLILYIFYSKLYIYLSSAYVELKLTLRVVEKTNSML